MDSSTDKTPLGFIHNRIEVDKYGNDISILEYSNGQTYRMVHYSKPYLKWQRMQVYAKAGRYLKITIFNPQIEGHSYSMEIGPYASAWGKVPGVIEMLPDATMEDIEVIQSLQKVCEDNPKIVQNSTFSEAILHFVNKCIESNRWEVKPLREKKPKKEATEVEREAEKPKTQIDLSSQLVKLKERYK